MTHNPPHAHGAATQGVGRLAATVVGFVIAGALMVGYLWEVINDLLAGHVHAGRVLIAIPVAVLFIWLLRRLSRTVALLDGSR